MKYDESDNIMIRATRVVTDKLGDVFSKLILYVYITILHFPNNRT